MDIAGYKYLEISFRSLKIFVLWKYYFVSPNYFVIFHSLELFIILFTGIILSFPRIIISLPRIILRSLELLFPMSHYGLRRIQLFEQQKASRAEKKHCSLPLYCVFPRLDSLFNNWQIMRHFESALRTSASSNPETPPTAANSQSTGIRIAAGQSALSHISDVHEQPERPDGRNSHQKLFLWSYSRSFFHHA